VRQEYLTGIRGFGDCLAGLSKQNGQRTRGSWMRLVFAGAQSNATSGALRIFLIFQ
jgi:hypothetical protein